MSEEQQSNTGGFKAFVTVNAIRLIGLLPLSVARGLGEGIARLCWLVQDRASKVTLENLRLCYPNMPAEERKVLAKQSMIETGRLAAEICVIRECDINWLNKKIFKVHGEDLIKEEIAKGKGLILLAPHIGNWEVLSLTLPGYGKLTALYQPPKQAYLEPLIKKAREKTGATLVPTNRRGVAKLLASLRSGGITAVLPDQNPKTGSGDFSPFFGIPAYTMSAVYGFSQRADCAVIYGFVKRVKGGFETYFIKAPDNIYSEDKQLSLDALNEGVENCISYCPEQYQWEYKRFKKRPEGEEKFYRF